MGDATAQKMDNDACCMCISGRNFLILGEMKGFCSRFIKFD